MSAKTRHHRGRRLLPPVLAALLVGAGLPTTAAGLLPMTMADAAVNAAADFAAGSYVVILRDDSWAAHAEAQRAAGEPLDTTGPAATAYADGLLHQQDAVLGDVAAEPTYRYTTVLNGFAVTLTSAEATDLAQRPDVRSVTPDRPWTLSTDQVPQPQDTADKLGLRGPDGVWARLGGAGRAGKGLVVGTLDTGIEPGDPALDDTGMPPPPAGFAGSCDPGEDAADWPADACDNKLVSARYFVEGLRAAAVQVADVDSISPLDVVGLGTDHARIAAGRDTGDDAGMAPMAHVASSKVCWRVSGPTVSCYLQDSVAAIETAVEDGVDAIAYPVALFSTYRAPDGGGRAYDDPVDLAFRGATSAGVFVAAAGGDDAPQVRVQRLAPWVTTAAAAYYPGDGPVARVTERSARGPAGLRRESEETVLKPELGAPGPRTPEAAAHLAGLALLQRQAHPGWSAMALKSSMMTSANEYAGRTHPFVGGAGFVDPSSMLDAPLVFDSGPADWDAFLADPAEGFRLNLASIQVPALPADGPVRVQRRVTNVSDRTQTFIASVATPATLDVLVEPTTVSIAPGRSATVDIRVTNTGADPQDWQTGSVTWTAPDAVPVRIPVAARGETFPLSVPRISGADRYETAALIAAEYPEGVDTIYLSTGAGFADALAAGPAAAAGLLGFSWSKPSAFPAPILLTEKDRLPAATRAALLTLKPRRTIVLGGTGVISDNVRRELVGLRSSAPRVAGEDRYATAAAIANLFPEPKRLVYIVNGSDASYADALAASAAAIENDAVVLPTKRDEVPTATLSVLSRWRPQRTIVIGGENAVSQRVFERIRADRRIAGTDRYSTAAKVSATFGVDVDHAYIASGRDWPDALAGSVLAGIQGGPVLITEPDSVPAPILGALDRLSPQRLRILGGTKVVTPTVEAILNEHYLTWVFE